MKMVLMAVIAQHYVCLQLLTCVLRAGEDWSVEASVRLAAERRTAAVILGVRVLLTLSRVRARAHTHTRTNSRMYARETLASLYLRESWLKSKRLHGALRN